MITTHPLDPDLLAAFRAVVETGNFTRAAERLRRNQSTLSMQIKRLETAVGDKLLERGAGTAVRLTARGEIVLTYARRLLALQEEALAALRDGDLQGTVRLGTPEDFATAHLPQVLADFARSHPQVALEITCDLTLNLLDRFGRGEFDLALIKREPAGDAGGVPVWREPLVWVTGDADLPRRSGPLPLALSPHPCVYRRRALAALGESGRAWRLAYTCESLAGTLAAVRAGLGITVLPRDMVPRGLIHLESAADLPRLAETEIALITAPDPSRPALRLRDHMIAALERA